MQRTENLLRVIIVDDEDFFRGHLKAMLNWNNHGFVICAEASNGREAMDLIRLHSPSIVITDIQMPEMDGLSLIAHIAKEHPGIQVVALSGYDEYQYVRAGMKHGLLDYLLKHQVTANTLLEALNNARIRLDDYQTKEVATRALTDQATVGLSELRRGFLKELLAGSINTREELFGRGAQIGVDMTGGYFVLLVAEIDQMNLYKSKYTDAEWMVLFSQMTEMIEGILRGAGDRENQVGLILPQPESRFTVLLSMPSAYSFIFFYNYVNTCIGSVQAALKKHYNTSACYSISDSIIDFQKVPQIYEKLLAKLKSKVYHEQGMVFREEKSSQIEAKQESVYFGVEDESHIRSLLRDGHMNQLRAYIDSLFEKWRIAHVEIGRLQMIFADLLSVLSRLARQRHIELHELMKEDSLYNRVAYMTLDEMKQFFLDACEAYAQYTLEGPDEKVRELTQKACSFIRKNYKSPISLTDVAEAVDVNPSYLSRVFKSDMGKTVVEYVNETRVEGAKNMMKEGVPLKEIAIQLGFSSTSYFMTVFKQITGKTPTQYKKTFKE